MAESRRVVSDAPGDNEEHEPTPVGEREDCDEPRRGDPPIDERERRKVAASKNVDNRAGLQRDAAQQRVDEPSHKHGPIVAGPEGRKAGRPARDEEE